MTSEHFISGAIISGIVIFYFIFTIQYFLSFRKTLIFSGRVKMFHLVMIWIIPFVWILILKSLTRSTPGSYEIEKKSEPQPFSDNNSDAAKASSMGF